MKFIFLIITLAFCMTCFCQKTIMYSIQPTWDLNSPELLRANKVRSDSVFFYKKRKNNKDSSLIMTQFFDSSGNLIERDEYSFNGELFRITNYTYLDTLLSKKEIISKEIFLVNGSNLSREIITYDYDESGNVVTEKEYSFFGDSLKSASITERNKEYDSLRYLVKEFVTLPKAKRYLHHVYKYTGGKLAEVKTFSRDQSWMYSYLYEYNEMAGSKSVYLYNDEKTLTHEFFYNDEHKLLMEKDYEQGHGYLNQITQIYSYSSSALLESQSLQNLEGKTYYYKHFYSK